MSIDRERWFKDRTYHHRQFSDIDRLVEIKREKGLKVSLCMPTLNEAATVGRMVRVFRTELMERHPLLDQLAVIDSRSTDGTVEAAESEGADVYTDDEILGGMEPASGKGEALWKSLFVLDGDLIAWVDSDIDNVHPRFAYGIIGPLITDDTVDFVKAFYERPFKRGEMVRKSGGGRVTELVVRPLLNLFYPDLAGFIQPLSGEYAGRRDILTGIPFLTGYGVESGLLLDVYKRCGLGSMAQVDLEVREHYNQSLQALSKMSFAVMQAILRRLADSGKVELLEEPEKFFNAVEKEDGRYLLERMRIEVVERPPMNTVAEYIEKREEEA